MAKKERNYLKKKDKRLGDVIEKIGMLKRPIDTDIFTILEEQVSRQARETVFGRLQVYASGRLLQELFRNLMTRKTKSLLRNKYIQTLFF